MIESEAEASAALSSAAMLHPGERFSHVTAARIWGMPLPRLDEAVHVTSPPGPDRRRRAGVVAHRRPGTTVIRAGLPVSSPLDTFIELATLVPGDTLVAVGDWMLCVPRYPQPGDPRPLFTRASLATQLAEIRAWGSVAARDAARLVSAGVESPRETALRLLLLRAGIPEPECGMPLVDEQGLIGYFDMVWPHVRVVVEYDGDQHRTDTRQYEKDIRRFDRAAAVDWRVVRVRAQGLSRAGRPETVARVRAAFRAARRRR